MKEILNVIHNTIYQFFDVCDDDEEVPMSDKDKLLLEVNKAICNNLKALEQQPCEDCISREEAKKLIQGKIDDIPKNKDGTYGSMFGQYVNGLYCAKTAISYMPSVVPQTKRGKWIETKDDCNGINFYDFSFECSKCGKERSFKSNYCPNCGADMRESEDKE